MLLEVWNTSTSTRKIITSIEILRQAISCLTVPSGQRFSLTVPHWFICEIIVIFWLMCLYFFSIYLDFRLRVGKTCWKDWRRRSFCYKSCWNLWLPGSRVRKYPITLQLWSTATSSTEFCYITLLVFCRYLSDGLATTKSDVYAFGIVLFEIISGKEAITRTEGMVMKNPERRSLASIVSSAYLFVQYLT